MVHLHTFTLFRQNRPLRRGLILYEANPSGFSTFLGLWISLMRLTYLSWYSSDTSWVRIGDMDSSRYPQPTHNMFHGRLNWQLEEFDERPSRKTFRFQLRPWRYRRVRMRTVTWPKSTTVRLGFAVNTHIAVIAGSTTWTPAPLHDCMTNFIILDMRYSGC